VNAHHQNGRAEARIRRLQEMARTMLIHAKSKWPQEISANLWPYAMRMANEANNVTPNMNDEYRRSFLSVFGNDRPLARRWTKGHPFDVTFLCSSTKT
jgi:hypothetical protein